jgi:hypothetical protein
MLFVQTGFAATAAAVLNSAGAVQINGRNVPSTTPVFAGDKLQTNDQSTGTVSVAETSLQIHPGSNVVYGNDSLEVIKGAATVKTAKAYRAMVHGLSIRPEAAASEFTVQAEASKVTISALKGSLAVGSHIKVPQGQTLVLAAATGSAQSGCVDNHKTDAEGKFLLDAQGRFISCVDQTTTGGGTTTTTITDNTKLWTGITFAVTGGVAATAIAIVKNSDKAPVSPAGP